MALALIILTIVWTTVWMFLGGLMGAVRVRHSAGAQHRYGRFLLGACVTFLCALGAAWGMSVGVLPGLIHGEFMCIILAALIAAPPVFGVYAMRRANAYLEPDPRYCSACGYDMRGSPTAVCPECGHSAQ